MDDDLEEAGLDLESETPDDTESPEGHEAEGGDEVETGVELGQDGQGQRAEPDVATGGRKPANELIRELKRERQEAAREREELRSQLAQIQQHRNQPDPQAAARQAQYEQEQLALMDPQQQLAYFRQQDAQRFQSMEQRLNFQLSDMADRTAFQALQASKPIAAKYASDVEALVARERSQGRNVSREVALKFVLGEKILEKGSAATTKQRNAASGRVASQVTNPRSPGGIARESGARGDDIESLGKRLRGVEI